MLKLATALVAVLIVVGDGSASAQCTCPAEIGSLATELANLRQQVNALKVQHAVTRTRADSALTQIGEVRTRTWAAFRRGSARLEEIFTSVETQHGLP